MNGMNVSIETTANTDDEGRALLTHLGMPFRQPRRPGVRLYWQKRSALS